MDASLIIPIYKAEKFLEKTLASVDHSLSQVKEKWELLLVLDASPDRSKEICDQFASLPRNYSVRVLENSKNLGKGGTVKHGMLAAQGKYRIFNDCDLAYPMDQVLKLYQEVQGHDIAIASRAHPDSHYIVSTQHSLRVYKRHLISRVFNHFVHSALPLSYQDTQAGLKAFKGEIAEYLFSQSKLNGFSFDVELLYLAEKAGLSIKEVAVSFHHHDQTTISFHQEGIKMMKDILKIRYWDFKKRYQSFEYSKEFAS